MYQPYLIANFETGYDRERQPWLLPDESQFELFDGFVYRGVWQKREGYSQLCTGQKGGVPYCESRMVHTVTISANEVPDGMIDTFTFTVSNTYHPLRRGGFRAIDTTALGVQAQLIRDNGVGGTLSGSNGTIDSVLNYTTTLATPQSVTFNIAPSVGHVVTLQLDIHQGFPVMGVMNFYTQLNTQELIVADTTYINKFDIPTNRLVDISPTTLLTGDKFNFMSWTNYPTPANLQRLLFVNNKDPIQAYDGTSVTPFPVYTTSSPVTTSASGVVGDGTSGPYTLQTPANTGILPGSLTLTNASSADIVTDNQVGVLGGNGTGTVDYLSGTIVVTFTNVVNIGDNINWAYISLEEPIETALHIFQLKDRLVVLYTTEDGVQYGHRIRVSGTGAFGDIFTSDAIGAGIIDVPDDTFISSADLNRDDLLIFTVNCTWIMKYTQNDVVPFTLDRIDQSRGSDAPYGTITYLNRTNAASQRGFIICDGYSVERSDDKIPDYSFNDIDQDNFRLCFAGSVDVDRDHYLLHPSPDDTVLDIDTISDRILVTNYEEDNFSIYRLPLSCMGTYVGTESITWDDLLIYESWDEMASVYGNWNAFTFSRGTPFSVGGGHHGQITRLNVTETEDYPVKIRDMSVIDGFTLQLTTDFQEWEVGDYVNIEAVSGMLEANGKQGYIKDIVTDNYTFQIELVTTGYNTPYTTGGTASKTIQFQSKTKKFNPYADQDKKVSCGWVYFYVSTSGTDLTDNKYILSTLQTNPCQILVPSHGYVDGQQIYIYNVGGMTELNNNAYNVTVIDANNISLDGVDATGFTPYTTGGFCSSQVDAILHVNVISNDTEQSTQLQPYNPSPYQVNLTSHIAGNGIKKWYKLWLNQTARFIQLEVINNQAGSKTQIHAIMFGFAGVGRLI